MKFVYCDESGDLGSDPVVVFLGVVIDAARLRTGHDFFVDYFGRLVHAAGGKLAEVKGTQIIKATGPWKSVPFETRMSMLEEGCTWLSEGKRHVIYSAIESNKWPALKASLPAQIIDSWVAGFTHLALQIQRAFEGDSKGLTALVIDHNHVMAPRLSDVLWTPDSTLGEYFDATTIKKQKGQILPQLLDSVYSVCSGRAGVVQIADLAASVLRRHAELEDHGAKPLHGAERSRIKHLSGLIRERLVKKADFGLKNARSGVLSQAFWDACPPSLRG